jgi:hypothetical protein
MLSISGLGVRDDGILPFEQTPTVRRETTGWYFTFPVGIDQPDGMMGCLTSLSWQPGVVAA